MKKALQYLLYCLLILSLILFGLDKLPSFDIKSQFIKSFAYLSPILLIPTVIIYNLVYNKKRRKIFWIMVPIVIILGITIFNPLLLLWQSTAWQTQTIHFQNTEYKNQKVEFQLRDVGALGYKKRTVQVTYITKYFMIVSPPCNCLVEPEWEKVDIYVNEVGMK